MNGNEKIDPTLGDREGGRHSQSGDYSVKTGKYQNLVAKVLCVLTAATLWFYVAGTNMAIEERKFTGVPVTVENVDVIEQELGMSVISGYDYTVDLTLQGPKAELDRLSVDDISAYVDVSEIKAAGEAALVIQTSMPAGINVTNQSASLISVYIDNSISKKVPVKVSHLSYVFEPFFLGTPEPSVSAVSVTGPAAELDKIDHALVFLDLMDLGRLEKTVTATGIPVLKDINGEDIVNAYVKLQTGEITVRLPVYTKKNVKLVPMYEHGYYNSNYVSATVSPETITVKGDPDDLAHIDEVGLLIDETEVNDFGTNESFIEVPIGDLGDVENISGYTSAKITFRHNNTETFKFNIKNISVRNPGNLDYYLETASVDVELRGTAIARTLLNESGSNIRATVDLGGLSSESGTVTVPLDVEIVGISNLYPINSYSVSVVIK